jgi:hypothetical protein
MAEELRITKSERKLLRELVGKAWDAELSKHLNDLFADFQVWADQGMSAFELSDKIHQFHNGISRELYGRYTNPESSFMVPRAVAFGLLDESALGESLARKLASQIEMFLAGAQREANHIDDEGAED